MIECLFLFGHLALSVKSFDLEGPKISILQFLFKIVQKAIVPPPPPPFEHLLEGLGLYEGICPVITYSAVLFHVFDLPPPHFLNNVRLEGKLDFQGNRDVQKVAGLVS